MRAGKTHKGLWSECIVAVSSRSRRAVPRSVPLLPVGVCAGSYTVHGSIAVHTRPRHQLPHRRPPHDTQRSTHTRNRPPIRPYGARTPRDVVRQHVRCRAGCDSSTKPQWMQHRSRPSRLPFLRGTRARSAQHAELSCPPPASPPHPRHIARVTGFGVAYSHASRSPPQVMPFLSTLRLPCMRQPALMAASYPHTLPSRPHKLGLRRMRSSRLALASLHTRLGAGSSLCPRVRRPPSRPLVESPCRPRPMQRAASDA